MSRNAQMIIGLHGWPEAVPGAAKKGRPRRSPTDKKRNINITPSAESRAWLDPQVGAGKRWSGYTHFFDWAVVQAREQEGKRKS
jgi:hypothetical protein